MPSTEASLVLFTRIPVAHHVKTRLMPALSADRCAALQQAMTLDVARAAADLPLALTVCYGREWRTVPDGVALRDAFLRRVRLEVGQGHRDMRMVEQIEGDLGRRMRHALEDELGRGARSCMLMGCDVPEVTSSLLAKADSLMRNSDVVLCPSVDGGYWLVGLRESFPELFEDKSYGGPSVFENALRACQRWERSVGVGPTLADVDVPDDLVRLADAVCTSVMPCYRHTAALVRDWRIKRVS